MRSSDSSKTGFLLVSSFSMAARMKALGEENPFALAAASSF